LDELFGGRHFACEIIVPGGICGSSSNFRDLVEMVAERGLSMDHTTIMRWVDRYAP
jgi:transposase-like protein